MSFCQSEPRTDMIHRLRLQNLEKFSIVWGVISLVFSLTLRFVDAAEALSYCSSRQAFLKSSTQIPFVPNWFQRIKPDGSGVGVNYSLEKPPAPGLGVQGNAFFNLQTGSLSPLPGVFDPVWSPDGRLLAVVQAGHRISLYLTAKADLSSYEVLSSNSAVYESMGVLEAKEDFRAYRMIQDQPTQFYIQDYISDSPLHLNQRGEPYQICRERKLSLPVISKNAQMLSALDLTSGTTKIFSLPQCEELVDLGVRTGKIDFDFTNSLIAFHVTENAQLVWNSSVGYYDSSLGLDWISNIYTFDLKTKEFRRLTYSGDSNTNYIYPNFTNSGDLIVLRVKSSVAGDANHFLRLQPTGRNLFSLGVRLFENENAASYALSALGAVIERDCEDASKTQSLEDQILNAGSLSDESCQFIAKNWERLKRKLPVPTINSMYEKAWYLSKRRDELKEEDISRACDLLKDVSSSSQIPKVQLTYNPFTRTCGLCHSEGNLGLGFYNPELLTRKELDLIRKRVTSEGKERMPPAKVPWTDADKTALITFIDKLYEKLPQ